MPQAAAPASSAESSFAAFDYQACLDHGASNPITAGAQEFAIVPHDPARLALPSAGPLPSLGTELVLAASLATVALGTAYLSRQLGQKLATVVGTIAHVLLGVAMVLSASMATLEASKALAAHGRRPLALAALRTLQPVTAPIFVVRGWPANPARHLGEILAAEGIARALAARDVDAALGYVDWPVALTEEGRTARAAAMLHHAARRAAEGHLDDALDAAQRAAASHPGDALSRQAVNTARASLVVAHLDADVPAARRHLDAVSDYWKPVVLGQLLAAVGREQARLLLDSASADMLAAANVLQRDWARATRISQRPLQLGCDLVSLLEPLAIAAIERGELDRGIGVFREVESIVAGTPEAIAVMPRALMWRGVMRADSGRVDEGITDLEEALGRAGALERDTVARNLSYVLLLRAERELGDGQYPAALATALRADTVAGHRDATRDAVAGVRVAKADWHLARGEWAQADVELQSARTRASRANDAQQRLHFLPTAGARIAQVNAARQWAPTVPHLRGERPVDRDGDGVMDALVYFGSSGQEGWTALAGAARDAYGPQHVAFMQASDSVPSLVLRDRLGSGRYDELTTTLDGDRREIVIEEDCDGLPDIRAFARGSRIERVVPLSGRLSVRVASAAIAGVLDPFTRPDAFYTLQLNDRFIFQSETVLNNAYPTWRSGIVLAMRLNDQLRVQLHEDDLFDEDEWIGDIVFTSSTDRGLPESGMYRLTRTSPNVSAVVELHVTPTQLPVGYRPTFEGPLRHPLLEHPDDYPELSDLLGAIRESNALIAERQALVKRALVGEALILTLIPRATIAVQLIAATALDQFVLKPLFSGTTDSLRPSTPEHQP